MPFGPLMAAPLMFMPLVAGYVLGTWTLAASLRAAGRLPSPTGR